MSCGRRYGAGIVIHRIGSDLRSFKTLSLRPGLNILASVKAPSSTSRQTRNGAGKTSVVEIVHFLLGSSPSKESIFKAQALAETQFTMTFDLRGERVTVTRSCAEPGSVVIDETVDTSAWPVQPSVSRATGERLLKVADWNAVLGELVFGVNAGEGAGGEASGGPSFRSLFPYFARRYQAGGFQDPTKHFNQQQVGSVQVALTYLLGLDWTVPDELQRVREREKGLRELKKAANAGTLGKFIGVSSELRSRAALLGERVARLRKQLADYQVVEEYHEIEKEASDLTRQIGALSDANFVDQQLQDSLRKALESEEGASIRPDDLEKLYRDAGVALPGLALKRFEEVQKFHASVLANRRSYLEGELAAVEDRLKQRDADMRVLNERLTTAMRVLNSSHALDTFLQLQSELTRLEAEHEATKQRLLAAEQLESQKTTLDIDRKQTFLRLQQDHREQQEVINEAIVTFEGISEALYERAGSLSINPTEHGPVFDLHIQGERSKGITSMQIFCFDMMLTKLATRRGRGPGFLIHDSHLFDGVDERQVGMALKVGADLAKDVGFQYVVTMNDDALPKETPRGFDPRKYVLPVTLSDATDDGGLFGMRFD